LLLLFSLLESGAVLVIDDALNGPVGTIVVRRSKNKTTFHLNSNAAPFLTMDRPKIAFDETLDRLSKQPREPWSVEKMTITPHNRAAVEFAKKFVAACQREDVADRRFVKSHIRIPLRVRFSIVDENGTHGTAQKIRDLKSDPATAAIGLPLCVGDGGLDDVTVNRTKAGIMLELTFGSGPNEQLYFAAIGGTWMLVRAEWFDH
jgi:hypothetical protein